MRMIRNAVLLAGFSALAFAQKFMPMERHERAAVLAPLRTATALEDVTQWPTKVYAAYALPNVKWAMAEMGIPAEPLPIDPVFFVESAADEQASTNVDGLLEPLTRTRPLTCNGAGSFHHLSYAICHEWIDKMAIPYTLIMFDAHDDAAKPTKRDGATVHCGMWGHCVMETSPSLARFIGIGVDNNAVADQYRWLSEQAYIEGKMDLYSTQEDHFFFGHAFNRPAADFKTIQQDLAWKLVGAEGYHYTTRPYNEPGFNLLDRIPTEHVYISVDMDVLHPDDFAEVEWQDGNMRVKDILQVVDRIAANHTLIGADICGYPKYSREIQLSTEEAQLDLRAYQQIYDTLARHLAAPERRVATEGEPHE